MARNSHLLLDDLKLQLSRATLSQADLMTIRLHSLSNLNRWKSKGTWSPVYDEWLELMMYASDDCIIGIMTCEGDEPNRLRQSMPYVGMLDSETRLKMFATYQNALASNDEGTDVGRIRGNTSE